MASLPGQREVDRQLERIRTRVSELRRLEEGGSCEPGRSDHQPGRAVEV
jgi:hypothetical protein